MAIIIRAIEDAPEAFPDAPSGLSAAAAALDPAMIWRRLEAYLAHRWSEREVIWTVEGPGEWTPPLTPATLETAEYWDGSAYVETALAPGPLGHELEAYTYRLTATVGGGPVPEDAAEAFRRLAEYLAADAGTPGSSRYSVTIGGNLSEAIDRNPAWMARALQNSGAADLLRRYRRAA
jgi:hypothetical protein